MRGRELPVKIGSKIAFFFILKKGKNTVLIIYGRTRAFFPWYLREIKKGAFEVLQAFKNVHLLH